MVSVPVGWLDNEIQKRARHKGLTFRECKECGEAILENQKGCPKCGKRGVVFVLMDNYPESGGEMIFNWQVGYPAFVRVKKTWYVTDESFRGQDGSALGDYDEVLKAAQAAGNNNPRARAIALIDALVVQRLTGTELQGVSQGELRGIITRAKFAAVHIWQM